MVSWTRLSVIFILFDIFLNVETSSSKVPVILVGFNETLIFSADFRKKNWNNQVWSKSEQCEPSYSMRMNGND
jgi:hypothetical protein